MNWRTLATVIVSAFFTSLFAWTLWLAVTSPSVFWHSPNFAAVDDIPPCPARPTCWDQKSGLIFMTSPTLTPEQIARALETPYARYGHVQPIPVYLGGGTVKLLPLPPR